MFYFIGFLRRTPLFGLLSLPISVFVFDIRFSDIYKCAFNPQSFIEIFLAFMFWSILAYPIFVAIHLLAVKISDKNRSIGDAYFRALGNDLISPFKYTILFFMVVFGIHKIKDDSAFHNFSDFIQILFGFIWTIAIMAFMVFGFIMLNKI